MLAAPLERSYGPTDRVLETRLESQVVSLKRDMVLELYLQKGDFWEKVAEVRRNWDIEPLTQPPPRELYHPLLPPALPPQPPSWSLKEESDRWYDTYERWMRDLESTGRLRIPPGLIGEEWRPDWGSFISVCVWFQPRVSGNASEPKLLEYAEAGGPWPESLPLRQKDGPEYKPLTAVKPPIRFVKDPAEESRIGDHYWYEVLLRAWELHIKAQGIGFGEMLAQIERDYPEIEQRRFDDLREDRKSDTAWILVDENTRKKDLDFYFRMITERQGSRPDRGRDKRDRLTCVECAVLHKQHGWEPEQLAKRYHWDSPHDAENYIKDGRVIFNGS